MCGVLFVKVDGGDENDIADFFVALRNLYLRPLLLFVALSLPKANDQDSTGGGARLALLMTAGKDLFPGSGQGDDCGDGPGTVDDVLRTGVENSFRGRISGFWAWEIPDSAKLGGEERCRLLLACCRDCFEGGIGVCGSLKISRLFNMSTPLICSGEEDLDLESVVVVVVVVSSSSLSNACS